MQKTKHVKLVLFDGASRCIWGIICFVATIFTTITVGLLAYTTQVQAATSSTINFQARLLQASGAVVPDGYYNVQFKLYDGGDATGSAGVPGATGAGTNLWTETYYDSNGAAAGNDNRVRIVNGYLTVNLGSQTAFSGVNWDQELWLTMNIGGAAQTASPTWDGEMNPRLKFTASPYALASGKLQTSNGANTSTLGFASQSTSRSLLLPDEGGTLCIQGSSNCGFAATTGAVGYIQNTNSQQASSNFNISGNGVIGTAASIGTGVAPANGVLTIGTNSTTTNSGGLYFGTDTNLYRSNANELKTDSAFLAAGRLIANSNSATKVGIGVALDGTTAATSLVFGNNSTFDTNLYRNGVGELKTDGAFLATGRVIANSASNTARTGLGIDIDGTTAMAGISLGATTFDTKIFRQAANVVGVNGSISLGATDTTHTTAGVFLNQSSTLGSVGITTTGTNAALFRSSVVGDTNSRYTIRGGGSMVWGSGTATQDVQLSRTNSGQLTIESISGSNTSLLIKANSSQSVELFRLTDSTGATNLTTFASDGSLVFGSTNTANLYRGAADTLKTDDSFVVGTKFNLDIANNRLVIGPSGGDTTGTLTILGTKTNAGDPTGTAGAMYYNSSLGSFRCYVISAWQDCGPQIKKVATDVTSTSTTYANVSDLTFALAASTDYAISCKIAYQSAATTTGVGLSWNGPTTPTLMSAIVNAYTGTSGNTSAGYNFRVFDTGQGITGVPVVNSTYVATMDTVYRNGTTAGNAIVRLKSLVASSQVTIKAGSICQLTVI